MDHRPPPPTDPTQPPPDHPQNAVNASPQLNSPANHGGDEEGSAQQNSLQMKNFRALVFKFIKPLTPADESLIEQRLRDFFPAINVIPDHPPYSAMIEEAVEKLNRGRGTSEEAISEYIKNEYNSLPWAHRTILAHHLNKLSKKGDSIVRCEQGYILRSPPISSSPCPSFGVSSDYSPYTTSSSSSGSNSDSPTPKRRRLKRKRKMKRKKSRIYGNGRGGPRMPIPIRGPGRPRKKDEIEMFKRKMMIQASGMGGTRKTIKGMKWGSPRNKNEIEKFKKKIMIQARETGGARMTINGKKRGRPRKNDGTSEGYQRREEQSDVGEEHHQVLEEDNQQLELENVVEDHNQVADIEMEQIKENNEVGLKNQVVLEQSKAEERNLAIGSEPQGRENVKKQKQKKQERVNSVHNNLEERQNGLEENEQSAEMEVIVDLNQTVPDHPPYSSMIEEALEKLNEGRGSSEEAISEFIKNEYNNLPRAHPILVAHHLNKLSSMGDIIVRCEQGYILCSAIINSTTESDYNPSSTSYSSSSISLGSDDSSDSDSDSDSDSSPIRRSLKRTRNRKKSQIQGKGRGRPRKNNLGRGRGRPRKKDEIDGQFIVHDETLKRMIQKREKRGSREKIQGRKRGRPRKSNEISEGYQLREEQIDVAEEHRQAIKEVNQSVELEDVIEDHNQVVDTRMEEFRENNDVQLRNQVVSEQSNAEEENLACRSQSQGGDVEEWEKHQKQEKVINELQIQPEEHQNEGGEENEEAAEKEVINDQSQREELHTYIGDEKDVVMVESVAQVNEPFDECSRQQTQGEKVGEGECEDKEQHIEIGQEGVQLEYEISEGQCQGEELQIEAIQLEIQLENIVEMIVNEAQEDGEVEKWNGQREHDKGGSLEHHELEEEVTDALEDQIFQKKQLMDVIVEKNQQCELEEQYQGEETQDNNALKEKRMQHKLQGKEIVEQDQLQGQKVEAAEEVIQHEQLQHEVFKEEILREVEVMKEQLELGLIMDDKIKDDGVEKSSDPQNQVEGESVLMKEVEEQLDDVIGDQVEPQGKCMEGTRENIQPCEEEETKELKDQQEEKILTFEHEETMEQQDWQEEHIQTYEQEDEFIIKGDCLAKPETEESERLHPQEEQQNEEISAGEIIRSEGGGESAEEWSGEYKEEEEEEEEEQGEKSVVNHLEANDVIEKQDLTLEQCSEGNKAKVHAHELSQKIITELKDQNEQQREEEMNVEAFEKENQLQGKRNVGNIESLQSYDVCSDVSNALPCKAFWSLMEDEKDKFLNNFRDQEMKSPCQEGEISDSSSIKSEQERMELPHLKSSPKSHIEEVSCLQHSTSHTGEGRSSKLIICALPCIKIFSPSDHQNKSEQTQSGREGLRSRSRNIDAVATPESQPVRRSPRNLNISSEVAAKSRELDHSNGRSKRSGLRPEKKKKAGV